MTANQLQYWKNQEQIRTDKANEALTNAKTQLDYVLRNAANAINADKNTVSREGLAQNLPLILAQIANLGSQSNLNTAKTVSELGDYQNVIGQLISGTVGSNWGDNVVDFLTKTLDNMYNYTPYYLTDVSTLRDSGSTSTTSTPTLDFDELFKGSFATSGVK